MWYTEKKLKHETETETDDSNANEKSSTDEELLLSEMSNDEITVSNTKESWKLCEAEDRYKLIAETAIAAAKLQDRNHHMAWLFCSAKHLESSYLNLTVNRTFVM